MTSTTAQSSLRLTRNQLAIIAHNDAEIIKQLERLVAIANLAAAPTTVAPPATLSLESGDAVLTRQLSPGRYLVRTLLLLSGTTTSSIEGTANATGSLALSVSDGGADTFAEVIPSIDVTFFSTTSNAIAMLDGVITVDTGGAYSVRVQGSGSLLQGSYFSVVQVSS